MDHNLNQQLFFFVSISRDLHVLKTYIQSKTIYEFEKKMLLTSAMIEFECLAISFKLW